MPLSSNRGLNSSWCKNNGQEYILHVYFLLVIAEHCYLFGSAEVQFHSHESEPEGKGSEQD